MLLGCVRGVGIMCHVFRRVVDVFGKADFCS